MTLFNAPLSLYNTSSNDLSMAPHEVSMWEQTYAYLLIFS
jgi:hypothetical protein